MGGAFAIKGPNRAVFGAAGERGTTFHARGPNGGFGGTEIQTNQRHYSGSYGFTRDENGQVDQGSARRSFSGPNLNRDVAVTFDGSTYEKASTTTRKSGVEIERNKQITEDSVSRSVQVTSPNGETVKLAALHRPRVINGR